LSDTDVSVPGNLRFDDKYLPIVTVIFDRDGCSDGDIESMIAGFEGLMARQAKYSVVFDGGGLRAIPNARQRKRVTEWEREHAQLIRRLNVGTALVADSALVRGAVTATRWLSKPVAPETVFANLGDAGTWCLARLEMARIPIPSTTRDFVSLLVRGGSDVLRTS
jgi:hypothetical protein